MRKRICKNCGEIFDVPTGKESYLCEKCARNSKISSVLRERKCKICGASFMGYPRSFFCPECSAERKRQQKKTYNRRNPARPLGSIDICEACGKEYIVKSGLQKYCPDCAKEQVDKKIRQHKREYMAENKEKVQALKNETRGKRYICPICGKEFEKHTSAAACSDECEKELRRRRQNRVEIKHGKRKLPAAQRYDSGLPKSGVVGVAFHEKSGKWQATYRRKYIGLYDNVEQAAEAIEKYKMSDKTKKITPEKSGEFLRFFIRCVY